MNISVIVPTHNRAQLLARALQSVVTQATPPMEVIVVDDGSTDDTPLLQERVITSFRVLDLIVHLEHVSGRPVVREQLAPGSFRDIATIARVFLVEVAS